MAIPILTAAIEWSIEREESAWKVLDAAISRKKQIADSNFLLSSFTSSENMEIYSSVFNLCTMLKPRTDLEAAVYQKSLLTLHERIVENVIPRLLRKHGAELLNEVTKSWTEFKAFADSLYKFFWHLDRFYTVRKSLPSVKDAPRICLCDHVCERLYGKIQEAAMNLIIEERDLLLTTLNCPWSGGFGVIHMLIT